MDRDKVRQRLQAEQPENSDEVIEGVVDVIEAVEGDWFRAQCELLSLFAETRRKPASAFDCCMLIGYWLKAKTDSGAITTKFYKQWLDQAFDAGRSVVGLILANDIDMKPEWPYTARELGRAINEGGDRLAADRRNRETFTTKDRPKIGDITLLDRNYNSLAIDSAIVQDIPDPFASEYAHQIRGALPNLHAFGDDCYKKAGRGFVFLTLDTPMIDCNIHSVVRVDYRSVNEETRDFWTAQEQRVAILTSRYLPEAQIVIVLWFSDGQQIAMVSSRGFKAGNDQGSRLSGSTEAET